MNDAFVWIHQIRAAAADRPPEYMTEIMSSGVVEGDYLRIPRERYPQLAAKYGKKPPTTAGPGTELTKLLARVGITAKPGCSCKQHASQMDAWGPDGCEANLEKIVGWLRHEAQKRRLPWVDSAGRLLIKRAIRNARRAAAS